MNTVENSLRTALHDLAPEPPGNLADTEGTYRRARRLRRNRQAGVAFGLVLVTAIVAGALTAPARRSSDSGWVAPGKPGAFPDWPRRGDLNDPAVDRAAIDMWKSHLRAKDVRVSEEPRILYAGDRTSPVVVFYAVTSPGGERLVVMSQRNGGFLTSDRPASPQGHQFFAVQVGGAAAVDCRNTSDEPARLVVLGPDELREAQWRQVPNPPFPCPGARPTEWAGAPLTTGPPLPIVVTGEMIVTVRGRAGGSWSPAATLRWTDGAVLPHHTKQSQSYENSPWKWRKDGSSAETMFFDAMGRGDGWTPTPMLAASLPDGTRVALGEDDRNGAGRVVLLAQDAERRVRRYLDVPNDPLPPAFAVVVDGFDARWLVVIGPADLRSAYLVDGDERHAIPLDVGWGAILIDAEPSANARVSTPAGDVEISARSGERI